MPVKLKQWHYAQAPALWHSALTTVRLHNAQLRGLCLYYNNVISDDPSPSRTLVHALYDQIVTTQKLYIIAKDELEVISKELGYFDDRDRMTWAKRADRRRYEYAYDSVEEEKGKDVEQRSVRALSEGMCSIATGIGVGIEYITRRCSNNDGENDSETSSQSSNSNSNSSTTTPPSYPPTPPLTPPLTPSLSPKLKTKKHVHFAPGIPSPTTKGSTRIRTPEEVEEEFQAANATTTRPFDSLKNRLKRKRFDEDGDDVVEMLAKRLKRLHLRTWPEAYYEAV